MIFPLFPPEPAGYIFVEFTNGEGNQDRHLSTTNLDESGNNRNPKAQLLTD